MVVTKTVCCECGYEGSSTPYCPECGAQDPWTERPAYPFDEDDLPIFFSHEVYQEGSPLWRSFASDQFGSAEVSRDDVAGLPDDFPDMDLLCVELWYCIDEYVDLRGPFKNLRKAREAVNGE